MPNTFNSIFDMYSGTMLKIAYGITRDKQLAEDAVQESFLRISKNMERLEDIHSPETRGYILTITRNTSLSVLKVRTGITNRECSLDEIENLQDPCDIEQEVISKVSFEELVSTIRELPKIYADVLYMDWVIPSDSHFLLIQVAAGGTGLSIDTEGGTSIELKIEGHECIGVEKNGESTLIFSDEEFGYLLSTQDGMEVLTEFAHQLFK